MKKFTLIKISGKNVNVKDCRFAIPTVIIVEKGCIINLSYSTFSEGLIIACESENGIYSPALQVSSIEGDDCFIDFRKDLTKTEDVFVTIYALDCIFNVKDAKDPLFGCEFPQ